MLRAAISNGKVTRYALAKASGVSESTLCKFVAGGDLKLSSVDRLLPLLELEVVPRGRGGKRQAAKKGSV